MLGENKLHPLSQVAQTKIYGYFGWSLDFGLTVDQVSCAHPLLSHLNEGQTIPKDEGVDGQKATHSVSGGCTSHKTLARLGSALAALGCCVVLAFSPPDRECLG